MDLELMTVVQMMAEVLQFRLCPTKKLPILAVGWWRHLILTDSSVNFRAWVAAAAAISVVPCYNFLRLI